MLMLLFPYGMNAPHRKALFSQRRINHSPEGFGMPSTNIYADCKPYSCENSMGQWV